MYPINKENVASKITAFLCVLYIWPLVFALVNYYFVRSISGNVLCILYYACMILTYYCYGNFRIEKRRDVTFLFIFLLAYGIISMASGAYVLIYNGIFFLPIIALARKSTEIEDKKFQHVFLWTSLLSFFITMLLTLRTLAQYPGASRVLASNSFNEYGLETYRKMGTGGFDFIYSIVILIPISFVAVLMTKKKFRVLSIFFFGAAVLTVFLSGYTTAILLMLLTFVLFLCMVSKRNIFIFVILLPAAIFMFQTYRSDIAKQIYELSSNFGSKAVEGHLIEIADILAKKTSVGDLDRASLYRRSYEAFLSNPIFGTYASAGTVAVSGHSTFLDLLGGGGLFCFVPYVLFLWTFYLYIKKKLNDKLVKAGWNISTVIFTILQFVNPIFANYLIIFSYIAVAVIILKALDRSKNACDEAR